MSTPLAEMTTDALMERVLSLCGPAEGAAVRRLADKPVSSLRALAIAVWCEAVDHPTRSDYGMALAVLMDALADDKAAGADARVRAGTGQRDDVEDDVTSNYDESF